VEKTALDLGKRDRKLLIRYLTDYSVTHAEAAVSRWRELGEHLICKYNDGYIKDETGRPQERGYPESWLREVLRARPEQFKLRPKEVEVPESRLVD
jgi:hypothetical protein